VGANFFSEPYLLTNGGGPDNSSISPVLLIYRQAIEQNHAGYASAIGVMLALGVMLLSLFNRFVLERS
jgi:multiple sugar transport system permease protein